MPLKPRTTLKSYFETNDTPTQSNYEDLIDSVPNFVDDNPTYGFNWLGDWDDTLRYVKYDSVYYDVTGASYVCIKAHDAYFVPTNTTYWSKISEKGADGKYVTSVAFVGDDMVFTFDDSSTETIVGAKTALKGDTGNAATADAGTTTTLAAGESATVTNVGTNAAAIFNFAIPQGIQGVAGADGTDGACVESVAFVGNDIVMG